MNKTKALLLISMMVVMAACAPMMRETANPETTRILPTLTPIATMDKIDKILATYEARPKGTVYVSVGKDTWEFTGRESPKDLQNPTFDEMISFLNKSTINWNEYISSRRGRYVCLDFACDLQDEAAGLGIRSAFVSITFPPGSGSHALIAFETTDKGLIYFEPQVDHRMKVEVGRKYWSWIYWPDYDYHIDYDDTVMSIQLLWNPTSLYCP